ncbi:MAG: helix-turn-helix transcriptional regulator [Clostridia bacterium]|nr:helix-turn-helix transcriptional regulator [Clostridia bacterium]
MIKDVIKKLRKKNKISQEELADKLYVSRALVAKWELGKRYPSGQMLEEIAKVFNVDVDYLIGRNDPRIEAGNELSECVPGEEGEDDGGDDVTVTLLARKISEFLRTLPEEDRKIFMRRYYYYDDPETISRNFKISIDEIRVKLTEIRLRLRNYFEKEGL